MFSAQNTQIKQSLKWPLFATKHYVMLKHRIEI